MVHTLYDAALTAASKENSLDAAVEKLLENASDSTAFHECYREHFLDIGIDAAYLASLTTEQQWKSVANITSQEHRRLFVDALHKLEHPHFTFKLQRNDENVPPVTATTTNAARKSEKGTTSLTRLNGTIKAALEEEKATILAELEQIRQRQGQDQGGTVPVDQQNLETTSDQPVPAATPVEPEPVVVCDTLRQEMEKHFKNLRAEELDFDEALQSAQEKFVVDTDGNRGNRAHRRPVQVRLRKFQKTRKPVSSSTLRMEETFAAKYDAHIAPTYGDGRDKPISKQDATTVVENMIDYVTANVEGNRPATRLIHLQSMLSLLRPKFDTIPENVVEKLEAKIGWLTHEMHELLKDPTKRKSVPLTSDDIRHIINTLLAQYGRLSVPHVQALWFLILARSNGYRISTLLSMTPSEMEVVAVQDGKGQIVQLGIWYCFDKVSGIGVYKALLDSQDNVEDCPVFMTLVLLETVGFIENALDVYTGNAPFPTQDSKEIIEHLNKVYDHCKGLAGSMCFAEYEAKETIYANRRRRESGEVVTGAPSTRQQMMRSESNADKPTMDLSIPFVANRHNDHSSNRMSIRTSSHFVHTLGLETGYSKLCITAGRRWFYTYWYIFFDLFGMDFPVQEMRNKGMSDSDWCNQFWYVCHIERPKAYTVFYTILADLGVSQDAWESLPKSAFANKWAIVSHFLQHYKFKRMMDHEDRRTPDENFSKPKTDLIPFAKFKYHRGVHEIQSVHWPIRIYGLRETPQESMRVLNRLLYLSHLANTNWKTNHNVNVVVTLTGKHKIIINKAAAAAKASKMGLKTGPPARSTIFQVPKCKIPLCKYYCTAIREDGLCARCATRKRNHTNICQHPDCEKAVYRHCGLCKYHDFQTRTMKTSPQEVEQLPPYCKMAFTETRWWPICISDECTTNSTDGVNGHCSYHGRKISRRTCMVPECPKLSQGHTCGYMCLKHYKDFCEGSQLRLDCDESYAEPEEEDKKPAAMEPIVIAIDDDSDDEVQVLSPEEVHKATFTLKTGSNAKRQHQDAEPSDDLVDTDDEAEVALQVPKKGRVRRRIVASDDESED